MHWISMSLYLALAMLLVYAKYYGALAATYITVIFYICMVAAGILVDLIFNVAGLIPTGPRPSNAVAHAHITWNYTSWLDLVALLVAGWLVYLFLAQRKHARH